MVDDDIVCCENACMRINEIGMKGEYAISGEEAIGKVERAHHLNDDYFAVILDLKMPGMAEGFSSFLFSNSPWLFREKAIQ